MISLEKEQDELGFIHTCFIAGSYLLNSS